jgi:hypothetical protein
MTIALGDKVRDSISGFDGIATGRFEYLSGCVRIEVTPDRLDKDGKLIDYAVIDELRLVVISHAAAQSAEITGGPRAGSSR